MIKKIAILCLTLFLSTQVTYATEWIRLNVTNTDKYIYLDKDSIYRKGNLLYYIIRYKDNSNSELVAYIKYNIDADKMGIIKVKNFENETYTSPAVWAEGYAFMGKVQDNSVFKNINSFVQDDKTITKLLTAKEQRTKNAILNNSDLINKHFVQHPEMKTYIMDVQSKIRENWELPVTNNGGVAKVLFKISRDGELLSCEIKQSSGNSINDESALNAVKKTAPFNKFPDKTDKNLTEIPVLMSFDYYVIDMNKK